MRWILTAVAVIVALVLAVVAVGYSLPISHVAIVSAKIPAPPESVWNAITTPAAYPSWRPGVTRVEMVAAPAGGLAWRETSGDETIGYVAEASEPPRRFVTRIADEDLPFGGSWEHGLAPDSSGTRVTIIERGEVHNPVYRFVSRFIVGHTATLSQYMKDLGRRFGAEAAPEVIMSR